MRVTIFALIMAAAATTALAQAPDLQFRAAQQKETVEGDLTSAIKLYASVADSKTTPPALAARALVGLGRCYERLGSTEAPKAYERVVAQFGKEEAAAEARQRLANMPGRPGSRTPEAGLVTRKVLGDLLPLADTLTKDGRYTMLSAWGGMLSGATLLDLVTGERKPVRRVSSLLAAGENTRSYRHTLSPDGRRFAFDVSASGRGELRIANVDGSGSHTLVSLPGKLTVVPLDWSSDGRTILAFAHGSGEEYFPREFLLVDTNGQGVRPIRITKTCGASARFSPDGRWIAFETVRSPENPNNLRGNLFRIRTDGSGEQLLVQPETGAALVGWAPDGGSVLFVSEHLDVDHLYAVSLKEGAVSPPVSLMKGFPRSTILGMTREGALLYSTGTSSMLAYTAKLSGPDGAISAGQPVNAQSQRRSGSATWSPDGRVLAYGLYQPDPRSRSKGAFAVMVRDVVSGQEREVGRFPLTGAAGRVEWTPDSKALLLPVYTADGCNVLRLDLASGRSEPLIPAALVDSNSCYVYPQASPDGKYLYYIKDKGKGSDLVRLDLAEGQAQQLATGLPDFVFATFALSRDGRELAVPIVDKDKNATVLRVLGPEGDIRRDLITVLAPNLLLSANWSPDGQQMFFSRTLEGSQAGLFRIPASGGAPVAVGTQDGTFLELRVHPNGEEIAFLGRNSHREVWRLEGLPQALARLSIARGAEAVQARPSRAKR
ncbi:MAG: hypothetical protein QOJ99_6042 [Bryobacterales bacterium]|nr:hypothetical protein [Bryobacterales bacterium]